MTLESAKVVAWTTSNWANSFTISKGTNADIAVGDCVITEYGVMVGQVTEVGSTWATVSTVIDLNTNIGALVSEKRCFRPSRRRLCHDAGGLREAQLPCRRRAGFLGRHGHDPQARAAHFPRALLSER